MSPEGYLLALLLFFLAGVTDYFDGYLARKYNAVSQLGEILDPIADKILILFVLFGLAINLSSYLIGFIGAIIVIRPGFNEISLATLAALGTGVAYAFYIITTRKLSSIDSP